MSTNSRNIAIGVSVTIAVIIIILTTVTIIILVVLKVKQLQRTKGGECYLLLTVKCMTTMMITLARILLGHDFNHGTTMTAPGEGASVSTPGQIENADGDETTPGEDVTKLMPEEAMQIVKAHICFNLEDQPKQLLSALASLSVS